MNYIEFKESGLLVVIACLLVLVFAFVLVPIFAGIGIYVTWRLCFG